MADELAAKGLDAGRWFAGLAVATNPVGAALIGGGAIAADVYANYGGDWEKWLVDHPGMVDTLIGMSPGMLSALGIPVDLATTLDLLGATYPDGDAVTTYVATHHDGAPDDLRDLMDGLAKRNDGKDQGDEHPSNIDVKIIRDANGEVTGYVVDIPGTKDWPLPGQVKSANDLGVNVDAMAGNKTVLQEGIHVVTAGSPVGRIEVSSNVQVLSLENRNDIVPHLDASDNPDGPNRTTVTFDNQTGSFSGNHSIRGNYTDVAGQLDNGSNPSVNRFKESASVFFSGDDKRSETQNYHVARKGVNELR